MTPGAIPFQKPARFALANRIRTTNPLVGIRLVDHGKFRVAPKLTRYSTDRARQAAENLAQYTGDIDVARKHAAEMLRRFRETRWGRLSDMRNTTSLSRLNAHLDRALEFGRTASQLTRTTNPLVGIKKTLYGDFRVAPKLPSRGLLATVAENTASYQTNVQDARRAAAHEIRRLRKVNGYQTRQPYTADSLRNATLGFKV